MKAENGRFGNLMSVLACMTVAWGATDSIASSTAQYSSTISSTSDSARFVEGDAAGATLSFTVNIVGHAMPGMRPVVSADSAVFVSPIAIDTSITDQYTVHLVAAPNLAPGHYTGTVMFRLCADAGCSTTGSGTQQSFAYSVTVVLQDWRTFQRNPAHTGFVNVTLDPTKFAKAWTWSRPAGDPEPIGGINAVATGGGQVYVSKDIYFGQGALYALKETDGSLSWTYALGEMASEGPPAFRDGSVYVPSTDPSEACNMWAVDAVLGTYKFKMTTACQWSNYFAPTPVSHQVLQTSQAGDTYSFGTADGALQWSKYSGGADQTTPAADAHHVYQYGENPASGGGLYVFDRVGGAPVGVITDPFWPGLTNYSVFSAPVVGANGDVMSFSGFGFSGRAASSSEQYESRIIVSYDIAGLAYKWRSANAYLTHPALANGVLYAARNAPAALDALSETDGHVLWSWPLPAGNSSFHRNVVVTKNLVFVSTDVNVYAIDLKTHKAVWQYPQPGMIAISAAPMLYIATGATLSDGNLVAIKLE